MPEAVAWLIDRKVAESGAADKDLDEFRKDLVAEQIEKIRLENAQRRAELVPVDMAQSAINRLAVEFSTQLDALAGRLAHEVAGMNDPAEIHSLLMGEARGIRATTSAVVESWGADE